MVEDIATKQIVPSVGVIMATIGRRDITGETLLSLAERKYLPGVIIVVGTKKEDLPDLQLPGIDLRMVIAPEKGLTKQRNYGFSLLPEEIFHVAFLDDDVEVHQDYFKEVAHVFNASPDLVAFSGCIMANGNIERRAARTILDEYQFHPQMPAYGLLGEQWTGLYGCTMNIRRGILYREQFDEALPLYALGEDTEMGLRLGRHGQVGGSARCPIVHLATRTGRITEKGVGYAQIINYLYFVHKDIGMPKERTYFERLIRIPVTNLAMWLLPALEKRRDIDRKGRFLGNMLAWWDVLHGRIDPNNLLKVKS